MGLKEVILEIYSEARKDAIDAIKADFMSAGFAGVKIDDPHGVSDPMDFSTVTVKATYRDHKVAIELSHSGYSFRCDSVSSASQGAATLAKKLDKAFG